MVKICHMTSVHKSNDIRIFVKECTSLAKKENYDVFFVAPGSSRRENGVTIVGIGEQPKGRIGRMLKSGKSAYKAALELNADLYHFHDPELLPYGAKLKKKGKHVIFDSHENYPLQIREKYYIPKIFRNIIAKTYVRIENSVCKKIDGVIFPCLEDGVHPFEGRAKHTTTIDNMPRLEEIYNYYKGDAKRSVFSVCYAGSLSEARGITNLMDACYEAKVPLILAGNFTSAEYEAEVRARYSFSCVDYRGVYNREQLKDILEEASLGASTLLPVGQYKNIKNLPTKVYEYMSMGLPVLLSDHPYGREVVAKYNFAELVDAENPHAMAEMILELKNDPERCRRLGQNGRKAVKEVFNWDVEEEKLFNFYEEICGE